MLVKRHQDIRVRREALLPGANVRNIDWHRRGDLPGIADVHGLTCNQLGQTRPGRSAGLVGANLNLALQHRHLDRGGLALYVAVGIWIASS